MAAAAPAKQQPAAAGGAAPAKTAAQIAAARVRSDNEAKQHDIQKAIFNGKLADVKKLITRDDIVHNTNELGFFSSSYLATAGVWGHYDIAQWLLLMGANVNSREMYGGSPLSSAVENGFANVAKLMIDAKAEINSRDDAGMTPLMRAAMKSRPTCTELLVAEGADLSVSTSTGQNVWTFAGNKADVKGALTRALEAMTRKRLDFRTALAAVILCFPDDISDLVGLYCF